MKKEIGINNINLNVAKFEANETPEHVSKRLLQVVEEVVEKLERQKQVEAYLDNNNLTSGGVNESYSSSSMSFDGSLNSKQFSNKNISTNYNVINSIAPTMVNIGVVNRNINVLYSDTKNESTQNTGTYSESPMSSNGGLNSNNLIQSSQNNKALIKAIKEKYLEGQGTVLFNNKVVNYWNNVIQQLESGITVQQLLKDPSHTEFFKFYKQYAEDGGINLESYRGILIKQFEGLISNQSHPSINKDQLDHLLAIKERLSNKNISIYNIISEYPELIDLLELLNVSFDDTFSLVNGALFPKLNIYSTKKSIYPDNIGIKAIYSLYELSNGTILDEVVVHAKSSHVIDIGKHTIGQHNVYPHHIVEFLSYFKYQSNISFKEVSSVKDQKYPLLIYDRVSKRIPHLNVIVDDYKVASAVNVTRVLSKKLDLDPENYIFDLEANGFLVHKNFEYSLVIPDKEGNELIRFETTNYEVFEQLFESIGYKIPEAQKTQIIEKFVKGIGVNKDKNTIDAFYTSLPSFLYLDENEFQLQGNKKHLSDDNLFKDLKKLLKGSVNDNGANEERAIVNICKAISYDRLYTLLRNDTKLLYNIFDELDGEEYQDFTSYLTTIVKHVNKKSKGSILFSNEYWLFRKVHVSTSGWSGGSKISFKSYEKVRNGFEDNGMGGVTTTLDKRTISNIPECHPLDLVTLTTKYPSTSEKPSVEVLAFELYNKVHKQEIWDWVNIATDVIGVLTIVGGTSTLIAKGATMGIRSVAIGAGITKEISSLLIQNKELTTWLKKEHKEVYDVWFTLDTTGNGVYLAMSLPQLARFITKGGKAIAGMRSKGFKSTVAFSKSLAQAIKTFYYRLRFIATDIVNISKNYSSVNKVIDETELIIKELKNIESIKIKWNTGINKTIEAFHKNQDSVKSLIQQLKINANIIEVNLKELKSIKSNLNNNLINNDLIKKVDKHIAKLSNLKSQNIEYLKKLNKIHDNIENKYARLVSKIKTSIVYRVQGGVLPNRSRTRIVLTENGNISILGKDKLYITIDDAKHQIYYYNKRGGEAKGAEIITFKVPKKFLDEIKRTAVTQDQLSEYKKLINDKSKYNTYRSKHPEAADLTKSKSAYGLYGEEWFNKLKNNMIKGTFEIKKPK